MCDLLSEIRVHIAPFQKNLKYQKYVLQGVWFAIMFVLIHLRRRQRIMNKRDIAESLEDARIYAESLNQVQSPGLMLRF
jgi:hypothetical protein